MIHLESLFLLLVCGAVFVSADTPANCTYDDLIGQWKIYLGPAGTRVTTDCSKKPSSFVNEIPVTFSPLDKLIKETDGEIGKFTLIYNQGFEFEVGYQKLFAFFEWQKVNATYSKYLCNRTMLGWAHDDLGREWSCFIAVKQQHKHHDEFSLGNYPAREVDTSAEIDGMMDKMFVNDMKFIDDLNNAQSSWRAGRYDQFEELTNREILQIAGKTKSKIVPPKLPKKELDFETRLPDSFDWRDVHAVNYVSPVRNQGACGSCYVFASAGMLEARIRIMTNNTQKPVFSTQDIVSCGQYSQGCAGGFPYLIAGKYAQDFGVIEEDCYPYQGKDTACKPAKPNCRRHYVNDYFYVGGYYGACTEDLMKLAIVKNGPVAVGFEVYSDFMQYKSGIYHHVFSVSKNSDKGHVDPFELTNHAVLVVGYGFDPKTGEKFWIVKNSWGTSWGEKGFFRIRRGNDECGIESLAVESFPVSDI